VTPVRKRRPVLPALIAAIVGAVIAGVATLLSSLGGPETAGRGAPVAIASSHSMMVDEVVDLVNEQRAKAGCEPLAVDPQLVDAAEAHSTDMAERDYFGHTTPEGVTFRDRILTAGFSNPGTGENLAHGQRDAEQVMAGWMASEGHRANILNCDFTLVGVGLDEDGMYWTQDFGKV
jgi:uncharacterized protein YkwD